MGVLLAVALCGVSAAGLAALMRGIRPRLMLSGIAVASGAHTGVSIWLGQPMLITVALLTGSVGCAVVAWR